MKLATKLLLAFAAVAAFSVSVTGLFAYRVAADRIPEALRQPGMFRGERVLPSDEAAPPSRGERLGPRDGGPALGLADAGRAVLLSNLARANLQAGVVALVAALLVGGGVAVGVTRPLARLTRATRRYGAGEREVRAGLEGGDEIAALGRTFDATADRLQAEVDRKERFTSDVAHELRTPLAVLRGELEAIQDGLMEADPARVEALLAQVGLLERLVHDLRTLTRAEAHELDLTCAPLDLTALARDVVATFQPIARSADVQLAIEGPDASEVATVDGDADRLRQVIGNLLDNAVRHAPPGGTVRTSVARVQGATGAEVHLSVDDDGPGLPEGLETAVFDRFVRGDAARRREAGGSGLGLAIVKALVTLHGGGVVAGPSPLGGARFEVHLPARTHDA
ncbi:MAG: ATP-binding protein [Trueperaceae bacterium]|nr:ATP-binding protein [Trueperaceae bacterium]